MTERSLFGRHTTPFIRQISEIIGDEKAVMLVKEFGGTTIYIPHNSLMAHKDNRIAAVIGEAKFEKLCESDLSGMSWYMPMGGARLTFTERIRDETGSAREIALRLGCSERMVRLVRSQARLS